MSARLGVKTNGSPHVLDFLTGLLSPEEILALRASPALAARVQQLLEKNRDVGLTPVEEEEWRRYEDLEHQVRIAKAYAAIKLARR
ncbi:MAG: hypothetical protein QM820_11975 [Minicystis sp.]